MTTSSPSSHLRGGLRLSTGLAALVPLLLLVGTAGRPLWLDEAASATLAELPARSFRHVLLDREGNGLLHTVLLRGWQRLGTGDVASRVPSVVAGLVALVLLTVLAHHLLGRRPALLVPPLLVTNPLFVRYVVETRSYALVLALVCASGLLLVRALQRQTVLAWSLYAVVLGSAVYAHYFALFVAVAHGLAVLLRRPFPHVRPLLPAAAVYLLVIAGLPRLMTDAAASGVGYLSGSPFARAVVLATVLGAPVLLVLAVAVLVRRARQGRPLALRAGERTWPYVLLVSWLLVPLGLAVVVSVLQSPVLAPRYLMVCLPPGVLLLAAVVGRLPQRLALAATALASVVGLVLGVAYLADQTEDWDTAAHEVQSASTAGDEVLFVAPYVRLAFERHWDGARALREDVRPAYPALPWGADSTSLFFDVPMPRAQVTAATADAGRVVLVVSHVDLYGSGDPAYDNVAGALRSVFELTKTQQLRGLRLETWTRRA